MASDDKFLAYKGLMEAGLIDGVDIDNDYIPVYKSLLNTMYRATKREMSQFDNTVVIKSVSDLQDIDSSKNYMIDGRIDMGDVSIVVPESGFSLSGLNGGRDTSVLYSSSDNYTMFISPDGGYSGNMVIESCTLEITGANSQVFNLDNDGNSSAIDITGVNFGESPSSTLSLGELSDYRQVLMNNVGFLFIDNGLTMNGVWTGLRVTTSIAIGFPASTLFKAGTGFTIDNLFSDLNFISTDSDAVFCDFAESNVTSDGGLRLTNFRTRASDPIPNITGSSAKALFRFCEGVRDTYVGGVMTVTTGATTTISSANTPVKMAGTTTAKDLSSFDMPQDNRLRCITTITRNYVLLGIGNFSGGNNDTMSFIIRHYGGDDVLKSVIDQQPSTMNGGVSSDRAESVVSYGFADDVEENDYFEMWVENTSDTTNIDTEVSTKLTIRER